MRSTASVAWLRRFRCALSPGIACWRRAPKVLTASPRPGVSAGLGGRPRSGGVGDPAAAVVAARAGHARLRVDAAGAGDGLGQVQVVQAPHRAYRRSAKGVGWGGMGARLSSSRCVQVIR